MVILESPKVRWFLDVWMFYLHCIEVNDRAMFQVQLIVGRMVVDPVRLLLPLSIGSV